MKQITKRELIESKIMDDKRRKLAISFRRGLQDALNSGDYMYDSQTRTITFNGFSYNIDKTFAETSDGEPIPLHYTYKTVKRLINDKLGDYITPQDECQLYEIKINDYNIILNENQLGKYIETQVNDMLDK